MRRITVDPRILGGKPVIEGTRMSVEFILDLLASGMREEDVLEDYPIWRGKTFTPASDTLLAVTGTRYTSSWNRQRKFRRLRLLADENVSPKVVAFLRSPC